MLPCDPVAPTHPAQGDTAQAAPGQLHRDSPSAQLGALRGALLLGCSTKTQLGATFWSREAEWVKPPLERVRNDNSENTFE